MHIQIFKTYHISLSNPLTKLLSSHFMRKDICSTQYAERLKPEPYMKKMYDSLSAIQEMLPLTIFEVSC